MAIIHYVKVKEVDVRHYHEFFADDVDQPTNNMRVQGRELLERAYSADQFAKEEKVTQTQAAELLISSVQPAVHRIVREESDGAERPAGSSDSPGTAPGTVNGGRPRRPGRKPSASGRSPNNQLDYRGKRKTRRQVVYLIFAIAC
jgi:hypothetical protein